MDSEDSRPLKIRKLSNAAFDSNISDSHDDLGLEARDPIAKASGQDAVGTDAKISANAETSEIVTGQPCLERVHENTLPSSESTAPLADFPKATEVAPQLSKNQQKKLRKKAEREASRPEWKALQKEKTVARRERKRAAKRQEAAAHPELALEKKQSQQRPVVLPVTIVIDCDFDDLMHDNERISLASQITRSYSDNKNSLLRAHLAISSFGGKLKERFDTVLTEHYKSWKGVQTMDCDFVEAAERAKQWMATEAGGNLKGAFSKYANLNDEALAQLKQDGEVVYLSSEADEDLTELKPYSTYIIGGLVDHNRHRSICYKRATKRAIKTARLPIGDFMHLQSRKVLATSHVAEIMIRWLASDDWGDAFMKVIPKRKGGTLRVAQQVADGSADEDPETPPLQGAGVVATGAGSETAG